MESIGLLRSETPEGGFRRLYIELHHYRTISRRRSPRGSRSSSQPSARRTLPGRRFAARRSPF
jgi:hypothetical protein